MSDFIQMTGAALGASMMLASFGFAQGMPPKTVGVMQVEEQDVPRIFILPGRAVAANAAEIRPRVSGIVTEVLYEPGQEIAKGTPMFRIDATTYEAGVAAAGSAREGWAFVGTFVTIALAVAGLFAALFPDVMPTSLADGTSLTTTNAAATAYTLKIMTGVAVVFTPIVLVYQGWTYWVFRKRISVHHIPEAVLAGESAGDQPAGSR